MFDLIVLVTARFNACMERMLRRGTIDPEQARLRRGFQWPEWVKARYADFIINNSGSRHMTEMAVNRVFDQIVGDMGRNCRPGR
jgi:dephospho-CoA kinase